MICHSTDKTTLERHRWTSTLILASVLCDIRHRHLLFRYRKQYVGLKTIIPMSDVPISTSESIPVSDIKILLPFTQAGNEPTPFVLTDERFTAKLLLNYEVCMSDIGYQIKVYSDIRYNVGFLSLQPDIRRFRYQAQSDSADHGFRTKCPPRLKGQPVVKHAITKPQ
jgi:hypothetical protein